MDVPLGVGVVGAGVYGSFCLSAFAEMPDVRIVGVVDADAAKARLIATQHSARAFPSLERMLQDTHIDIVT